jgi:hypothetical protein
MKVRSELEEMDGHMRMRGRAGACLCRLPNLTVDAIGLYAIPTGWRRDVGGTTASVMPHQAHSPKTTEGH